MTEVCLLQLPSPPRRNVFREWAGGMGTALPSTRQGPGHDQQYYDIPYLGLLYIARVLQDEGVGLHYVDGQAQADFDRQALLDDLAARAPRVLLSVPSLPSLGDDLELLAAIRAVVPGLSVILLGPTAKWFKERLLSEGHADAVMDEGEELLAGRNAARLARGEGLTDLEGVSIASPDGPRALPAREPMTNLDFVDFPAYELLDFERYESDYYFGTRSRYATVFSTKGCPYTCGYCPYPFGFGDRTLYRSPERIADDVARLVNDFGVEQILFRDQVFTLNKRHARAICDALIARGLNVPWICETRYDVIDRDLLARMYEAGCREVHYGLESGDPELFASVAKSDGPQSLELFADVIEWTRAQGMHVHTHLIVGMPDESWTSVRNTANFLRRINPDSVQVAYFVPYPGTPLYDELRASGDLGDPSAIDWEDLGSFTDPVLPTRHLSRDDVRKAADRLKWTWRYTLRERLAMRLRRWMGRRSA